MRRNKKYYTINARGLSRHEPPPEYYAMKLRQHPLLVIAVIIILISGFVLTAWTVQLEDNRQRKELLTETRIAEKGIDAGKVAALTGTQADLASPDYQRLKEQMARIQSSDPRIRFTYLLGQQPDETVFLFVDSEPPESKYYSPPGLVYTKATELIHEEFVTKQEVTIGPESDRWGTWVSGLVPITDPVTGNVIAVFGIDFDARDLYRQTVVAGLPAVLGTFLVLELVLTFYYIQQHNERERLRLAASEKALFRANQKLNLLNSITRHDIRNKLTVLIGFLNLSNTHLQDTKKLQEFIKKEIKAAHAIEQQINFTKDYQDMGVKMAAWQNVHASIRRAGAALNMRDVRLDVELPDLEVFADPLFEKVFYNLIDNALIHGGDQMKTIRISSHETDAGLTIVCEDDGGGISEPDKKCLFERGFGKNTGLGLFLSREILSITGISIAETGMPGNGARFEITVPKGGYRSAGSLENPS